MKHTIIFLLLAAGLSGCGPIATEPMPDIPQTVDYETVRLEYGEDDLQGSGHMGMVVGESSEIAALTRLVISQTNAVLRDHLNVISFVRRFPPTVQQEDLWIWRSTTASGRHRELLLRRIDDETLEYEFSAGPDLSDLTLFGHGTLLSIEGTGSEQTGSGILHLDFDAKRSVAGQETNFPPGRMALAFRTQADVRQIEVAFFDVVWNEGGQAIDTLYSYVQLPDKSGFFDYHTLADFRQTGPPLEQLSVSVAWEATRAGRAAARIDDGGMVLPSLFVEQCWNTTQVVTYALSTPTIPTYDGGAIDDCAPGLQPLDVIAPDFAVPPEDGPPIPGPHPLEDN